MANTEDYIPGVTPYVKPTEEELGFKPLSNAEFEQVKQHAEETKEERLGGPRGLGLHKTEAEFEHDLQVENAFIRQFEGDIDGPGSMEPQNNYPQAEDAGPDATFKLHWTFWEINDFIKKILGLDQKEKEKEDNQ